MGQSVTFRKRVYAHCSYKSLSAEGLLGSLDFKLTQFPKVKFIAHLRELPNMNPRN